MIETWRKHPVLDNVMVSTESNIKLNGKLVQKDWDEGYFYAFIGEEKYDVASLVWETFKGPVPKGYYPIHRNGWRTFNELDNLVLRQGTLPKMAFEKKVENGRDQGTIRKVKIGETGTFSIVDLTDGDVYNSLAEFEMAKHISRQKAKNLLVKEEDYLVVGNQVKPSNNYRIENIRTGKIYPNYRVCSYVENVKESSVSWSCNKHAKGEITTGLFKWIPPKRYKVIVDHETKAEYRSLQDYADALGMTYNNAKNIVGREKKAHYEWRYTDDC